MFSQLVFFTLMGGRWVIPAPSWYEYQEEAAVFFRSLGLTATTNAKVQGTRTSHDVDVLVEGYYAGFDIRWIVECKHWQNPVSKSYVLAFRTIVGDIGADRGIFLAESGYQSGAQQAVLNTNITLTSLGRLSVSTLNYKLDHELQELDERIDYFDQRLKNLIHHSRRDQKNARTIKALHGAGDWIRLTGTISVMKDGLDEGRYRRLPTMIGFMSDGNTARIAYSMEELISGLKEIAHMVGLELDRNEAEVLAGPDAAVLRRRLDLLESSRAKGNIKDHESE